MSILDSVNRLGSHYFFPKVEYSIFEEKKYLDKYVAGHVFLSIFSR